MNDTTAQVIEDIAIAALVIAAAPRPAAAPAVSAREAARRQARTSWVPSRNTAERR